LRRCETEKVKIYKYLRKARKRCYNKFFKGAKHEIKEFKDETFPEQKNDIQPGIKRDEFSERRIRSKRLLQSPGQPDGYLLKPRWGKFAKFFSFHFFVDGSIFLY
jgi:hypothetical protein